MEQLPPSPPLPPGSDSFLALSDVPAITNATRSGYGQAGRGVQLCLNQFKTKLEDVYHYNSWIRGKNSVQTCGAMALSSLNVDRLNGVMTCRGSCSRDDAEPPTLQRGTDAELGNLGGLPLEIVDTVLAFGSTPDLCRLRAVSKTWDVVIRDSGFAARQWALSAPHMVMTSIDGATEPSGRRDALFSQWYILDADARRWYIVGHDEHYLCNEPYSSITAMDGGLVCRLLKRGVWENAVVVQNPIARTSKVLPVVACHGCMSEFPNFTMVVDAASGAFMVVHINNGFDHTDDSGWLLDDDDPVVLVYDSATEEWRSKRNPPWNDGPKVGHIRSRVMFRGWLYTVMYASALGAVEYRLHRYDTAADVWEMLTASTAIDFEDPDRTWW